MYFRLSFVFNPRLIHLGFVVDKIVPGQIFLQFFHFPHVNVLPSMIHTDLHHPTCCSCQDKGENSGTFQKTTVFCKSRNKERKITYIFVFVLKGINKTQSWYLGYMPRRDEISKWKSTPTHFLHLPVKWYVTK